jgi:hypothetical protein
VRAVLPLCLALALAGCGGGPPGSSRSTLPEMQTQVRTALNKQFSHRGNAVYFRDADLEILYVVPAHHSWVIACGVTGLDVQFFEGSGEEPGIYVELLSEDLTPQECEALVPSVVNKLSASRRPM